MRSYHMLRRACGDSSRPGQLEGSLELSLQGVLEECGRLGKSEQRRWRLETPSAAAVVRLTETGNRKELSLLCMPARLQCSPRHLRSSLGMEDSWFTVLEGSVHQGGKE